MSRDAVHSQVVNNPESDSTVSEIGEPPTDVELRPDNCYEVWPIFVIKRTLRQKEGELVCTYISRFCESITEHWADWRHFSCPESAQALFCLGGLRNYWLRNVINRACFIPRSIVEIKTCLVDLLPYIQIAQEERRIRAHYFRKKLRMRKNVNIYPWDYLQFITNDVTTQISQCVWACRPLTNLEKPIYEILKLY